MHTSEYNPFIVQQSSVLNYLKDPLYLYHKIQFEQTWNRNNFEKKGKEKREIKPEIKRKRDCNLSSTRFQ